MSPFYHVPIVGCTVAVVNHGGKATAASRERDSSRVKEKCRDRKRKWQLGFCLSAKYYYIAFERCAV